MGKLRRERQEQLLKASELSFDDWVEFLRVDMSDIDWFSEPASVLERLTYLFCSSQILLEKYGEKELNSLLWKLLSESGLLQVMFDESLSFESRQECVKAINKLYSDLFAKHCSPCLSHGLTEPSEQISPLNSICYMFWDIFPSWGSSEKNKIESAILSLLEALLEIDNHACQESALHGLGHWHLYHASEAERIIDNFIAQRKNLPQALLQYAKSARSGCVN